MRSPGVSGLGPCVPDPQLSILTPSRPPTRRGRWTKAAGPPCPGRWPLAWLTLASSFRRVRGGCPLVAGPRPDGGREPSAGSSAAGAAGRHCRHPASPASPPQKPAAAFPPGERLARSAPRCHRARPASAHASGGRAPAVGWAQKHSVVLREKHIFSEQPRLICPGLAVAGTEAPRLPEDLGLGTGHPAPDRARPVLLPARSRVTRTKPSQVLYG